MLTVLYQKPHPECRPQTGGRVEPEDPLAGDVTHQAGVGLGHNEQLQVGYSDGETSHQTPQLNMTEVTLYLTATWPDLRGVELCYVHERNGAQANRC